MSAPLVDRIREQLGLAYTAHSTMDTGDVWANFVIHAVTTPDKVDALVSSTAGLLREQATNIDPVHLERAKNQLIVSRVRAGERTYAAMEQAVEELFASATVTPVSDAIAAIESIRAAEVQAVFERMLANPPAVAMAGKGAGVRTARQLAARMVAGVR